MVPPRTRDAADEAPMRIAAAARSRERKRGASAIEQPGKDVATECVPHQEQQGAAASSTETSRPGQTIAAERVRRILLETPFDPAHELDW